MNKRKVDIAWALKGTDGEYISRLYWWKENLLNQYGGKIPKDFRIVRLEVIDTRRKG